MLGSIASLVASLALIVLPVSAPCVCHGFTLFGEMQCCAHDGGDVKEQAQDSKQGQPRCCRCENERSAMACHGESEEKTPQQAVALQQDWIPASAGITPKTAQPRGDDNSLPCPGCPREEHKEVHNLSLLQPTTPALIDVTQAVHISATWFLPSVISHPANAEANASRHDTDRILAPPPLRFIEPVRLLI